jgi:hypothetical protein
MLAPVATTQLLSSKQPASDAGSATPSASTKKKKGKKNTHKAESKSSSSSSSSTVKHIAKAATKMATSSKWIIAALTSLAVAGAVIAAVVLTFSTSSSSSSPLQDSPIINSTLATTSSTAGANNGLSMGNSSSTGSALSSGVIDSSTGGSVVPPEASCRINMPTNGNLGTCASLMASDGSIPSGSSCTLGCLSTYQLTTVLPTLCTNGNLTNVPLCTATSCALTAPANGILGMCPSTLTSGASCQVTCNQGYLLQGSSTACLLGSLVSSQTCAIPLNYCILSRAITFGDVGTCTSQVYNAQWGGFINVINNNEVCDIHCAAGTIKQGTSSTCVNGVLTLQTCALPSCTVPVPVNGNLGTCAATLAPGSSCQIACNSGYSVFNLATTCSNSYSTLGTFTTQQTCVGNACILPSFDGIYGGTLGTCATLSSNGVLRADTPCQIECNAGFNKIGTATICSAGVLTLQTCQPSACMLANPVHGAYDVACNLTQPLAEGASCQASCTAGYYLSPSDPTACVSGQLLPQAPVCLENPCVVSTYVAGIQGATTGNCPIVLTSGSSCNIGCSAGYVRSGTPTMCSQGFYQYTQTCVRSCAVTPPLNGNIGTCGSLTSASSCSVECDAGYRLNATATTCNMNAVITPQQCDAIQNYTCNVTVTVPQSLFVSPATLVLRTNFAQVQTTSYDRVDIVGLIAYPRTVVQDYEIRNPSNNALLVSRHQGTWTDNKLNFWPIGSNASNTCLTSESMNQLSIMNQWAASPTCLLPSIQVASSLSTPFDQSFGWMTLTPDCGAPTCSNNAIAPATFYSKFRVLHTLWNNLILNSLSFRNRCTKGTSTFISNGFYTNPRNAWAINAALPISYTYSLWMRHDIVTSNNVILGCSDCTVSKGVFYLYLSLTIDVNGTYGYRVIGGHVGPAYISPYTVGGLMRNTMQYTRTQDVMSSTVINTNQWYHVAITYVDYNAALSTPGILTLYLNGVLESQVMSVYLAWTANNSPIQLFTAGTSANYTYYDPASVTYITSTDGGTKINQMRGHIADFGLWSSALSSSAVQLLYSDPAL